MAVKTPIIFQSRDIYGNKFALTQKLQLFHFTAFFHSFSMYASVGGVVDERENFNFTLYTIII
jgi:hypothetical protein